MPGLTCSDGIEIPSPSLITASEKTASMSVSTEVAFLTLNLEF